LESTNFSFLSVTSARQISNIAIALVILGHIGTIDILVLGDISTLVINYMLDVVWSRKIFLVIGPKYT